MLSKSTWALRLFRTLSRRVQELNIWSSSGYSSTSLNMSRDFVVLIMRGAYPLLNLLADGLEVILRIGDCFSMFSSARVTANFDFILTMSRGLESVSVFFNMPSSRAAFGVYYGRRPRPLACNMWASALMLMATS